MKVFRYALVVSLAVSAGLAGRELHAQEPPPPPPTVWNFLGIPQACNKLHAQIFNRRGNHPGLERKPPMLPLSHPANLESPIPAIKAAAEIKAAEDLAPQKIKAIKYLASIGCGCYDKDGKITAALVAATEDCTESVRLAAVEAIMDAAAGKACGQCHANCCCGQAIVEQLARIAYERDESGCFIEPSDRVRAAAVQALAICCPSRVPVVEGPPPIVPETPDLDEPPPPPVPESAQRGLSPLASSRRRYMDRAESTGPQVQLVGARSGVKIRVGDMPAPATQPAR